ncbi:MAG: PAS-domain containing protein [Acetobacteraceae bacterium]
MTATQAPATEALATEAPASEASASLPTEAPAPLPAEAVLEAMPIGVAVVDADRRVVLFNAAYYESLDLPAGSFPPGTPVADALRVSAYRGIYGPGEPEDQVAAFLASDRTRAGRLRRRTHNGRSFDVIQAPLPDGGYVVCAVETTALIAAQEHAESAMARVGSALATLRTGLAAFGPDGVLLFANRRFGELFGLAHDRPRDGVHFGALLDLMASREEFTGLDGVAFIAAQRAADRSLPFASRRVRSGGQVIDFGSDPLAGGGWTMTVTDVSALAQAEDEARRRAALLHSIVHAFPHGVCVYGADRRVAMFNRAYMQVMKGAPVSVGDHVEDIIRRRAEAGEYGLGDPEEIIAQQLAFDVTRPQMRKRRRPNGTTVDVRTTPLPDGGYISVVTDITQLAEAESEVSRRANELAFMLSNIRHGVMLWGPHRRLIASNAVASQLLELPPGLLTPGCNEDELAELMFKRGHFGQGQQAVDRLRALRAIDRSVPVVRQAVTRSGRVLDFHSDPTPNGGWVSTFTDVTEARAAEHELRRAKEAAEAANEAKSRFLATMSHELRTPLNAVIGFSDALLHEAANPTSSRVAEFAMQINDAGRQLLGLINIILDVARIESGRFDFASDTVDVPRLLRHCMRHADAAAQAAEIALRVEVPADLPALRADERRLQQALNHLVSNAVKFTEAGGTVTLTAAMEGDGRLLLSVRDSGIGIPAADLERVFEPFTQLDSSLARRFQGAGLGLYVSRALVIGHGGELLLRSAPGSGTVAEIRLPAERMVSAQ